MADHPHPKPPPTPQWPDVSKPDTRGGGNGPRKRRG
jgi:hypothetical protein